MTRQYLEHYEQAAMIEWAELMSNKEPRLKLLYAIPNAARRSPRQGAWMKAEGMKAGIPDLCLPVPEQGKTGLYIEMKTPGNIMTKEQGKFTFLLERYGHEVHVCYSAEEAINVIKKYLGI